MDALNVDSQNNSPIGRDALKDKRHWVRDEKTNSICQALIRNFELTLNRKYEIDFVRE